MEPVYFHSAQELHDWLEQHHATATELRLGFYKVGSGKPSVRYQEALDEALCYGWIDGVRHRIDDERYTIRFTPRRKGSIWSQVNIRRVGELRAAGRMTPAGLATFEARDERRTNRYSFEQGAVAFDPDLEARFRAEAAAWEFFQAQAPSYRRAATWWVISAKRDATRERRLETLIADSAGRRRIDALTLPSRRRPG